MPDLEREIGALRERADTDRDRLNGVARRLDAMERRQDRAEARMADIAVASARADATANKLRDEADDERKTAERRWSDIEILHRVAVWMAAVVLWLSGLIGPATYHAILEWLSSIVPRQP